nr:MAG TPA: hypothetical protein [Inoviridae sp.]
MVRWVTGHLEMVMMISFVKWSVVYKTICRKAYS